MDDQNNNPDQAPNQDTNTQPQQAQEPTMDSRMQKKLQQIERTNAYKQLQLPTEFLLHKKVISYMSIFFGAWMVVFGSIHIFIEGFKEGSLIVSTAGLLLIFLGIKLYKELKLFNVDVFTTLLLGSGTMFVVFMGDSSNPLVVLLVFVGLTYLIVFNIKLWRYKKKNNIMPLSLLGFGSK